MYSLSQDLKRGAWFCCRHLHPPWSLTPADSLCPPPTCMLTLKACPVVSPPSLCPLRPVLSTRTLGVYLAYQRFSHVCLLQSTLNNAPYWSCDFLVPKFLLSANSQTCWHTATLAVSRIKHSKLSSTTTPSLRLAWAIRESKKKKKAPDYGNGGYEQE